MKTRVLVRVAPDGVEWVASAYQAEHAVCTVRADSQAQTIENLTAEVEQGIAIQAREWLDRWRGDDDAPNCPEGAVKLPIDLWVCKLVKETCPIQAQVFIQEPERFFSGCLAPEARKQEIFATVARGKYDGFHHVPGRYLCVVCERERKKPSFCYHYPWELTHIEAYYPFVIERDWPQVRRRLGSRISLSTVSTALCAPHCILLAGQLDAEVAAQLSVLEVEVKR